MDETSIDMSSLVSCICAVRRVALSDTRLLALNAGMNEVARFLLSATSAKLAPSAFGVGVGTKLARSSLLMCCSMYCSIFGMGAGPSGVLYLFLSRETVLHGYLLRLLHYF